MKFLNVQSFFSDFETGIGQKDSISFLMKNGGPSQSLEVALNVWFKLQEELESKSKKPDSNNKKVETTKGFSPSTNNTNNNNSDKNNVFQRVYADF